VGDCIKLLGISQHLTSSPSVGSVIAGGDSKTPDAGKRAQVPMGNGQTLG
jgi:hypothetical protein